MFKNREYAQQIKDFSGLRWGAISPTDVDALLEFSNRLFIIVETKYKNSPIPRGQLLALERVCDAINDPPNKHCLILLTSHESSGDWGGYGGSRRTSRNGGSVARGATAYCPRWKGL